jgi:hypothetical protein
LLGILIPPVSIFLFLGFFRNWKKHILLFLPGFVFLAFHSYFPNKQERFILPLIPFIIILGYMGWHELIQSSSFWQKRRTFIRYSWMFFWGLNILPLLVVSTAYSKRNRVESMTYLQRWDNPIYGVTKQYTVNDLYRDNQNAALKNKPDYVIFLQEENIENRVKSFKSVYPTLRYETTIEPGFVDKVMHFLNPVNKNQVCFIYKI